MNPDTNLFEELSLAEDEKTKEAMERLKAYISPQKIDPEDFRLDLEKLHLVRPDGSSVPDHWSIFQVGEEVIVKNYTFRVAYINDVTLILEPVGIVRIDNPQK